ncbi:MAG: hypothetical protein AAF556_12560 [Pseudomonadota bacterium]
MMMTGNRARSLIVAMALGVMALPGSAAALEYVQGFDALPVMPGLTPSPAGSLIFDKPDGRILQAVLIGDVSADATFGYYEPTLRSLGWDAQDPDGPNQNSRSRQYRRGVENLQLLYQASQGTSPAQLILRLNPAPPQ